MAQRLGWLTFHDYDSRRSNPGLPDLLLVRERVVFAELKTEKGRLSEEQGRWLFRLDAAGAEAHVWRPADWRSGVVERVLRHREDTAA
jgi:hypothetical protein